MITVKVVSWDQYGYDGTEDMLLPGVPRVGEEIITIKGPITINKVVWSPEKVNVIGRKVWG